MIFNCPFLVSCGAQAERVIRTEKSPEMRASVEANAEIPAWCTQAAWPEQSDTILPTQSSTRTPSKAPFASFTSAMLHNSRRVVTTHNESPPSASSPRNERTDEPVEILNGAPLGVLEGEYPVKERMFTEIEPLAISHYGIATICYSLKYSLA